MSTSDPIRLTDPASGAPDELRALFQAGERDIGTAQQLGSLSATLGPLLGPSGAAGAASPSGSSIVGAGKIAALAVALVGGAVLVASLHEEVPSSVPPATTPLVVPKPAPDPAAEPAEPEPPSAAEPEPAAASDSGDAPTAAPRRAERAPSAPAGVEAEAKLLERARAALVSNPSHAYALTTEHKLRFPGGALAQEREVIAIEALRRLGKGDQASRRADDFSKSYPDSAHRHALDAGSTR
jgi:outer membrane biosynthesis protein TonB